MASPRDSSDLGERQAAVRRYSRTVRWMKVLLPVLALLLIGLIFLAGRERGEVGDIFTAEELARLGAGLRLDSPRFAGETENGEPFALSAVAAMPDSAMPEEIALEEPKGEITLADGRTLSASAREGLMRRKAKTLTLTGEVLLESSDGYRFTTERLEIDLGAKRAHAPGAVKGKGPDGDIDAGSFRAEAVGEELKDAQFWFDDRVRVLFIPPRES